MFRIRRSLAEPRMEMTPLIDVVLLLLTFFIFSLVLMVRAEVLDVRLPTLGSGTPAGDQPIVTVAIDRAARIWVDGTEVKVDSVADSVRASLDERPEARLVLAVDSELRSEALLRVVDALGSRGIGEFSIIGTPAGAQPEAPSPERSGEDPGGSRPSDESSLEPGGP